MVGAEEADWGQGVFIVFMIFAGWSGCATPVSGTVGSEMMLESLVSDVRDGSCQADRADVPAHGLR